MGFVKKMSELRGSNGILVRPSNIDICVLVCIDIRFRFVAVWSEAEWQDCSYREEMRKCLDYFQVLTDKGKSLIFMGREGLDRVCP